MASTGWPCPPLQSYAKLSVLSVSPSLGPASGGSTLRITGEGLRDSAGLCALFVSGEHRSVVPAAFDAFAGAAVCSTPEWAIGAAGDDAIVEVSLNGQEWTFSCHHFKFYTFAAASVEPAAGPLGGGTQLSIRGSGVPQGATPRVRFTRTVAGGAPVALEVEGAMADGAVVCASPAFAGATEPFDAEIALALNGVTFMPVLLQLPEAEAEVGQGEAPPLKAVVKAVANAVGATFRYEASAAAKRK